MGKPLKYTGEIEVVEFDVSFNIIERNTYRRELFGHTNWMQEAANHRPASESGYGVQVRRLVAGNKYTVVEEYYK